MWSLDWWRAAGERALRTAAQSALAVIGTGATGVLDINVDGVLSAAAFGALTSVLTSIAFGLPEADDGGEAKDAESN
jgi:hypothetical protein